MRGRPFFEKKSFVLRPRTLLFVRREFQRVEARMSEGEDKASSAVKEVEVKMKGEKKKEENYYVRLATNLVTTAKETRLVEDDTQDTFLKGELQQQQTECSWCEPLSPSSPSPPSSTDWVSCLSGSLGVVLAFLFLGQGGHLIRFKINPNISILQPEYRCK